MSKYVNKQALLKWLEERCKENNEDFEVDRFGENMEIINEIKSGSFDVDETEVQRLRAALVEIKQLLNENRENDGAFQSWNHMQAWKVATQALSTTTEQRYFGEEIINEIKSGRFDVDELEILIDYIKRFADYLQEVADLIWKVHQKIRLFSEDEFKKLIADLRNDR